MTNTEAIFELIKYRKQLERDFERFDVEPFDMAIEALKQEPCEDCISRQAVIDAIDKWVKDMGVLIALPANKVTPLFDNIHKLPPVTPQSRIGHWILQPSNKEQDERDFIWWKCSECGQVIYSETEQDRREFHAFCGRCGARMEVGK